MHALRDGQFQIDHRFNLRRLATLTSAYLPGSEEIHHFPGVDRERAVGAPQARPA
jgi:hypothetical protein